MRIAFFFLVLALTSCRFSQHEGYSLTRSNLHYQIHTLGDGEAKAGDDDYVKASIDVYDMNDSLLYRNAQQVEAELFRVNNLRNGGLNEAFTLMHEGDSASFIMEGHRVDLNKLTGRSDMNGVYKSFKMVLKLNRIYTADDLNFLAKKESWKDDAEMNEQIMLNNFLKEMNLDTSNYVEGIYVLHHEEGSGPQLTGLETVRVHYRAYFVDGTLFDNTYDFRYPLEFELGKPDQVIDGFLIGMRQMSVGGKASFVIPSQLAFGEEGSSTGIVPPFTTIVYDVELVSVVNSTVAN